MDKTAAPRFHVDRLAFTDTFAVWHSGTTHIVFTSKDRLTAQTMAQTLTLAACHVALIGLEG